MEIQGLCSLREIYRLIRNFEIRFQQEHSLCLNEGMLLCSLKEQKRSSSEIAGMLGLTNSNASKVIGSAEQKGFIKRTSCKEDKRKMYFEITETGMSKLSEIKCEREPINEILNKITNSGS